MFGIAEGGLLVEPSQKAVTCQSLRGIPQAISSKLQLDYPDKSYSNLARHACRIKEVFARTQPSIEQIATVAPSENASRLDALCNELNELKLLLKEQVTHESVVDVKLSRRNNQPQLNTTQVFFLWIYHLFAKEM